MTADRTHVCTCGAQLVVDECRYIGPQEIGDGEIALLFNCPRCQTTFSGYVLLDAAICSDCRHPIAGDAEDPKVIGLVDTTDGIESRVWCADCGAQHARAIAARSAA